MALDSGFAIAISLAGITIITVLVVIVNILTSRSKDGKKNQQSTTVS